MKETIKKLYLMQLRYGGISEEEFHFLPETERRLLVERPNGRFILADSERKKIKVVLAGGVFDIIHIGHVFTLTEAKRHGDVLVVAIADEKHIRRKGREPIHSNEYRKALVEALKPVDIAMVGFADPKEMVDLVDPDTIVYGYDQKEFIRPKGVEVVKLDKKIDDSKFKSGKIIAELGL